MSKSITKHKIVTFTYHILDEGGEIKELSDVPMEYVHGADTRVFPLIVEAMEGAKIGDTKEVVLTPENGFGDYDEDKTYRDKAENIPPEYQTLGAEASFQSKDGEKLKMKVVSVENGEVVLDGNHPFAGKTMTYEITVTGIRDATEKEIASGIADSKQSRDSAVH